MHERVALGMMSGTSLDGVDAAILVTDGERIVAMGPALYRAYSADERARLSSALDEAAAWGGEGAMPATLVEAGRLVTECHAEAAEDLIFDTGQLAIDVVGFHGQTVLHAPERGLTVQIGDAAALAERLGLPVVGQFRLADVAAGGQGAPFAPVYHRALADYAELDRPVCFLNLGGVSNLTAIGADGDLVAFDAGPGNALLDDWMQTKCGARYDEEGRAAARGSVDEAALSRFLEHPYFTLAAPKSLDRNAFLPALEAISGLSPDDGAATLAAMTAAGVARGLDLLPARPSALVVAGGGAHNPSLCRMIGETAGIEVIRSAEIGLSEDFIEAQAFAYLAVRHLEGLPLSFPGTTGVAEPVTGGILAEPA